MTRIRVVVTAGLLTAAAAAATPAALGTLQPEWNLVRLSRDVPGSTLPIVKQYRYRMAGKVRPLLFWIGRDEVGAAQIVWRRDDAGGVAYELLIGSDPRLAPRSLNRWGYIAEEARGSEAVLLGLISKSEEDSLGDVHDTLDTDVKQFAFSVIQTTVQSDVSRASLWTLRSEHDFTIRDIDEVLGLVEQGSDEVELEEGPVPAGARLGFLTAVAEMVHDSVDAHHESTAAAKALKGVTTPYVHGDSLHDLTLRSHEATRKQHLAGFPGIVVRGKFETRSRLDGRKTRFEIIYGLEGCLAEVPISIAYRPRWWLHVELQLPATDATTENCTG